MERCGGVIINFIGDAVLASFNVPSELPEPASVALTCYLACTDALRIAAKERKEVNISITGVLGLADKKQINSKSYRTMILMYAGLERCDLFADQILLLVHSKENTRSGLARALTTAR